MATTISPESGSFYDSSSPASGGAGGQRGTVAALSIRQQCEQLRSQLETERATFLAQWKDLNDHILPWRGRFTLTDVNKGDRRSQKIIDSTASEAADTMSAGIMSSVTSPARPWFKLTVADPDLAEQDDVKEWLHVVEGILSTIFLKSNLYDILPVFYTDVAVFGTAAMVVLDDDEDVIRCYEYPIGSYAIGNDAKLRARIWVRTFRYSVKQMVDQWGEVDPKTGLPNFMDGRPSTLSRNVQNLWKRNALAQWIDVVHVIRPNQAYDGQKIDAKYKAFESIYYELGGSGVPGDGLLEHSGFEEFPVLCLRWALRSEDVYGTSSPGMRALGDIRQLQTGEKRSAQAVEKTINPPLTGPARLMNQRVSTIAGDITYDDARDQSAGLRPIYQVKFDISQLEQKQEQVRNRIKRVFYADLFLMLDNLDRREITATEIAERKEEKLLALGPVLQRIDKDVLSPLIDRTFNIAARKNLIPPAPDALQGQALRVEYVSIMALAQKRVGIEALERTLSFVSQEAQVNPSVLDTVDFDELTRQYADAMGTPPKILKPQDQVDQVRQARAKQQQLQQAAENAPALAGALKDLGSTPSDGGNILSELRQKMLAKSTLGATGAPPSPVVQ